MLDTRGPFANTPTSRWLPMLPIWLGGGITIVLIVGWSLPSYGADGLTLVDTTIRVPSGMNPVLRRDIVILGENLTGCGDKENVSARDLFVEGKSDLSVAFENIRAVGSTGKKRIWLADARVSNLTESASLRRRVLLACGATTDTFDYTVTNRPEGTFTWTIKPATSKLVLADTHQTSLMVSVGDVDATNVRVAQSSLQDENSLSVLGLPNLGLCRGDTTSCQTQPFAIPRHASGQPVILSVEPDFSRPGIFKGTVSIAVDQKTDPESFELTVYSSRLRWKVAGSSCILAGILTWWFVSVFARQRAARAEALLPIAALRDAIDRLLADLDGIEQQAGQQMVAIRNRLQTIRDELDPAGPGLINLLPSDFPTFRESGDNTAYQQYISTRSQQIGAVSVLLKQGVPAVLANQPAAVAAGRPAAITAALQGLNAAAAQVNNPDDAKARIQDVLRTLIAALAAGAQQDVTMAAHAGMVGGGSLPSTTELRLSLRRLSSWVWFIWAMITLIAGIAALILTNQGFGTPMDYVKCFFWGLSIQAGGQQLQQLTPGAVATDFKIAIPK